LGNTGSSFAGEDDGKRAGGSRLEWEPARQWENKLNNLQGLSIVNGQIMEFMLRPSNIDDT
jgi:hypothetical protein